MSLKHPRRLLLVALVAVGMTLVYGQQSDEVTPPFHGIMAASPGGEIVVTAANGDRSSRAPNLFIHNRASGTDSTARILNDFPNADQVQAWSLAANEEEVVVAAVLVSSAADGTSAFQHLVLHYAFDGSLKAAWDTTPYMCHDIAENKSGTVYCYGFFSRNVAGSDDFLLHRYSPSGQLNGKFLDKARLPSRAGPPYANGVTGPNLLRADDSGHIAIWVAPASELLILNESSPNVAGTSLAQLAATPEDGATSQRLRATGIFFTPDGALAMQVISVGSAVPSPGAPPGVVHNRWMKIGLSSGDLLSSVEVPFPAPKILGYAPDGSLQGLHVGNSARTFELGPVNEQSFSATDPSRAQMVKSFVLK